MSLRLQNINKSVFFFYYRYLQEIGYTDTIIDVRSNRVRSLLGLNNNTDSDEMNTPALNGNEGVQDRQDSSDVSVISRGKHLKKVRDE